MNKFSYHAISTCCLLTAGKVKYGVSYRDIICLLTYTAIKQVQVTHAVIKTHSRWQSLSQNNILQSPQIQNALSTVTEQRN